MHGVVRADQEICPDRGELFGGGEQLPGNALPVAAVGADFLICPANTVHQALPLLESRSPLPWLHIAEVVAAEAAARGFRRLGLTGTRWLVESDVYPEKLAAHGIAYVRPDEGEREEINRIIMDELVHGLLAPRSIVFFKEVIYAMKSQDCDAVVLGCTEIPLMINDTNSSLPTLDSTRLLARAALRNALPDQDRTPPASRPSE